VDGRRDLETERERRRGRNEDITHIVLRCPETEMWRTEF
jgi:hypothetical protein